MLFTEIVFIPFLFITFILFFLLRKHRRLQILLLLIASYIFYGWWNVKFLWLLVFTSLMDYNLGNWIYKARKPQKRKIFLWMSLIVNLGVLGYFKYANFFIESTKALFTTFGITSGLHTLDIILPVGISFYTFQSLSYTLDIYFGKIKPTNSMLNFLTFVAAFPQLVAGPIVRAQELLPQLDKNFFDKSDDKGVYYIFYGLIKKMLVADMLGFYLVDNIFADPSAHSSLELMVGLYAYAFQIFFDFSAYSDIAIGLGKIFGLDFPVNFRFPYTARNPTEFWHKWHITLSTWFRDYLYIPMGGNRVSHLRHIFNLMVVMLVGGLWHGANWTFVVWGGLHGIYLVVHKLLPKPKQVNANMAVDILKILFFFHLVCLTWIFFRSPDLTSALAYLKGILNFSFEFKKYPASLVSWLLGVSVFLHYVCEPRLERIVNKLSRVHWMVSVVMFFALFALLSYLDELEIRHQAFIYFQF